MHCSENEESGEGNGPYRLRFTLVEIEYRPRGRRRSGRRADARTALASRGGCACCVHCASPDFSSPTFAWSRPAGRAALCRARTFEDRFCSRRKHLYDTFDPTSSCRPDGIDRRRISRCRSCPRRLQLAGTAPAWSIAVSEKPGSAFGPDRFESSRSAAQTAPAQNSRENQAALGFSGLHAFIRRHSDCPE